jgi:WD repeat-containing protein 68
MPFHHHQHSQSSQHGAAQGLFEAAQTLGSIGAPTGNLRTATLGTTAAGTDAFLPSNSNAGGGLQHSRTSALPLANVLQPAPNNYTTYDGPRRSNTIGRMADHSSYQQPPHLQEPPSQGGTLYSNPPPQASSVPGSLQPGGAGQGRPAPLPSAYTAPTGVPQINTNASQYSLPTRSNTMHSHSHSRSSPAGMDQQKCVQRSHNTIRSYKVL